MFELEGFEMSLFLKIFRDWGMIYWNWFLFQIYDTVCLCR